MIVTITQHDRLMSDQQGNIIPIGELRLPSEARTTAGAFAALNPDASFIRVASDTVVKLTTGAGQVLLIPASFPEYFGVNGGEVFTLAAV